jgi:hypothetical protein
MVGIFCHNTFSKKRLLRVVQYGVFTRYCGIYKWMVTEERGVDDGGTGVSKVWNNLKQTLIPSKFILTISHTELIESTESFTQRKGGREAVNCQKSDGGKSPHRDNCTKHRSFG